MSTSLIPAVSPANANPSREIAVELVADVISEVPAASLPERARMITSYHLGGKRSAVQVIAFNLLAGAQLIAAKMECGHGRFLKWCEKNLPGDFSHRTANYYMAMAARMIPEMRLSGLNFSNLLQSGGNITEKEIAPLLSVVAKKASGREWMELCRDYGVIPEKIPQSKRDNSPKKSREEREADRKAAALEWAQLTIARLEEYCAENDSAHQLHDDLPDAVIQELQDAIISTSRINRDLLKARRATRAKLSNSKARKGKSK